MKKETRTVYFCEHCNKTYFREYSCKNHEERCFKNQKNFRMCFGCNFLGKADASIYSGVDDYYSCEPVYVTKQFFFCIKKQIYLYTPQNEIKGNHKHIDDNGGNFENYPMFRECELYLHKQY